MEQVICVSDRTATSRRGGFGWRGSCCWSRMGVIPCNARSKCVMCVKQRAGMSPACCVRERLVCMVYAWQCLYEIKTGPSPSRKTWRRPPSTSPHGLHGIPETLSYQRGACRKGQGLITCYSAIFYLVRLLWFSSRSNHCRKVKQMHSHVLLLQRKQNEGVRGIL